MTSSRLYLKSSSFKMALLFTALLSAAVLSLGYFIYDFGREGLERDSEAALDLEINNILLINELAGKDDLLAIIEERIASTSGIHYLLADLEGNKLAGDLEHFPQTVDRLVEGIIVFEVNNLGPDTDAKRKVVAKIHTFSNGDQILVARDIDEFFSRFTRLRLLSVLSILCMLMVIIVSFLISLFVVSRINRMSDTALEIMLTGDLSQRLTVDSRWDDMSHLSMVFNEMLSRIESLVEGVKQVSNDIAHDLRTPLTRLRNNMELIQSGELEPDDLNLAIAEADQLLETFNALLRISRLEVVKERSDFQDVDIVKLLQDVYELYEPVLQEEGCQLELSLSDSTGRVTGDRNLLFQACVNVVDNAIKHGGSGGRIRIHSSRDDDNGILLEFEDSGPGIPASERERVFTRFYRCDRSRSRPGSGLGLSLVAAIVQLHDGAIELYDPPKGGLGVRIRIPIALPNITHS